MKYIVTVNNTGGLNPSRTFISSCVTLVSQVDNIYTVESPDGCDGAFSIETELENCTQIDNYQLCVDTLACDSCHSCVGNLCTPICTTPCLNGDCVECLGNSQCEGDKICINNTCQCPAGKFTVQDECVDCLTSAHCPPCTFCVDGTCVPTICDDCDASCDPDCKPNCNPVTGECVQCVTTSDCGVNQICQSGECQCAPGYRRDQTTNTCVPEEGCFTSDDCGACENCVSGDCVAVVCPTGNVCIEGICKPLCEDDSDCVTGQCVEIQGFLVCNNCQGVCDSVLDCDPGCLCINGICISIPDTENPCTGDCTDFRDCGEGCGCLDGSCYPCNLIDNDVICGNTSGCNPSDDGCEYEPCVGQCIDNTDCGDGCTCVGGQCTPRGDCDSPCNSGADCGFQCGCQDNECISCNQVSCTSNPDCPQGCYCDNGTCRSTFEPEGCDSQECTSPADCGIGCGCQGGQCISCNQVSCVTSANCPNGCFCDDGTCRGTNEPPEGCEARTCTSPNDCGENCGCQDGFCIPCESALCTGDNCTDIVGCGCVDSSCEKLPPEDPDYCNDTLVITKDDANCDLTATLTKEACCLCKPYSTGFEIVNISGSGTLSFQVRGRLKLGYASTYFTNPFLSQTLTVNELPVNGIVTTRVTYTARRVNNLGVFIPNVPPQDTTISVVTGYTNTDTSTAQFNNIPDVGQTINLVGFPHKITRITVTAQYGNILFPNTCQVNLPEKTLYIIQTPASLGAQVLKTYDLSSTTLCGLPLISFYRSNTPTIFTPSNLLESKYVPSSYTLSQPPELLARRYYGATTDCGCADDVAYSCSGSGATPLVFCKPQDFAYSLTLCNRKFTFTEDVVIDCDPMKQSGVIYDLYFNEDLVDSRALPLSGILYYAGTFFTSTSAINVIELKIRQDECEECTITKTAPEPVVQAELDIADIVCSTQETTTATIGEAGITSYVLTLDGYQIAMGVSAGTITIPATSGQYQLTVTRGLCSDTVIIDKVFTAPPIAGSYIITQVCDTLTQAISITTTQNLDVSIPDAGFEGEINGGPMIIEVPQGTYSVFLSVDGECEVEEEIEVNCCIPNPLDLIEPFWSCATKLSVPTGPNLVFTIGGIPITSGQILLEGTYTVLGTNGQCTKEYELEVGQCYGCSSYFCVETLDNTGFYDNEECDGECTDTPDPDVDITYLCPSGFSHTSPVGTIFTISGNPIGTGSIINAGSYTVNVFTPDTAFTLPLVVQQCVLCDPDCATTGCEVLQRSQFVGDVNFSWPGPMDDPISVTKFDVAGVWIGPIYIDGSSVIGAPLPLTVIDDDTPDVILDECPCTGTTEQCENCDSATQEHAWQNALNAVGVQDFLFETVQCKGVVLITYPTCFNWVIETTYYTAPNYYVITNGYDSVTNTVINRIEGFGTFSALTGADTVNGYGCGDANVTNTEVIDLSCCIDAVPNIGLQTCPDECNTPVPPPSCELVYRFPDGLVLGSDPTDINTVILYDNTGSTSTILSLDTSTETVWSGVDHATYETDVLTDLLAAGFVVDTVDVSTNNNPMLTLTGTNFINSSWVAGAANELDYYTSLPYSSCERSFCIGLEIIDLVSLDLIYVYTDTLMNVSASLTGLDITIPADRLIIKGVIEGLLGSIGESYDEVIVEEDYIGVRATQAGIIFFGELGLSDVTYDCPLPPEDECVCLTETIFGRNVIGLETNDGTQLLNEAGFVPTGYVLSSLAARTALQNALQAYYDDLDPFPCTPLVEVSYDALAEPTSTSTITLNCIPPDHPKALRIWQSGVDVFNEFAETDVCECTVRTVCETQEVFFESYATEVACASSTLNTFFTGDVTAVSLLDAPVGMSLLAINTINPTDWNIEFNEDVLSGSYTISFTDERDCVYYHTFNVDCAGCTECDFSLHGAGRLYGVVIDGVTYALGANVEVECSTGSPVFTPNQAAFEAALSTVLVNQGDCGTLTFEYTCEDGTDFDPNNCVSSNVLYPYSQWVKVRVLGAGSDIEGAVWGFPGCTVPLEQDYCCQQAGCNVQYIYGTGKITAIETASATYDLTAEAPPIDDAVAQCFDGEIAFSNIPGVLAGIEFVHLEESAPLTYCVIIECSPFEEGLDPNNCLTTLPNQDAFVRISIINSTLTFVNAFWDGTGFSNCAFPVENGCPP